jgi:hypothetical protein
MNNINIKFDNGYLEVQILPDVFVIIRNRGKEFYIKWENLLSSELERVEEFLQYMDDGKHILTPILDNHAMPAESSL